VAAERRDGTIVLPVIDKQDVRLIPLSSGGEELKHWIFGIAQDHRGFMWFATAGGLFRYDGYTLTPYLQDPNNPNSVSSKSLSTIYTDRSGILWLGTGNGLDRLDPARGVFTHYRHQSRADTGLSSDNVECIYQDRSGTLWIGTHNGLDRFEPSTGGFVHFTHNPEDPASLSDNYVRTIYEDRSGNLWVGTQRGLNKLDPATGRSKHFFHDPKNPRSLGDDRVFSVVEDRSGVLWVSSLRGDGLNALDVTTGEFTRYSFHAERQGAESTRGVVSMHADADGSLWLCTTESGLLRLDAQRTQFSRYLDGDAERIFEDAEGVMWVGTRNQGVFRFPRKPPAFVVYGRKLPEGDIQSVGSDSEGYVWIGTAAGVLRLDRKSGQLTRYLHDAKKPHSISNGLVSAIAEDHSGTMWFGTYGAGLNRFDRATGQFYVYKHDPKDPGSLSSDRVLALLVDHEGILWVGTEQEGLDRFDPRTGKFKAYRPNRDDPRSLPRTGVQSLHEDRPGALWIGNEDWLERFDRKSQSFTGYHNDPNDPGSLSKSDFPAIHEDRQGALWIATGDGLNRLDPSGAFTKFTMKDGLPDLVIRSILEDRRGDLWLSTDNGLSHFFPQTKRFQNYFESDGLPSNKLDVLGQEACQTASGEMVFASANGLIVFDPDQISPNSYVPPVVLTDFLLFNKPVSFGRNSPLQIPIWGTDAITLNHDQGIFALEFAALSYVDPERNRYRYRLEGLEKDWNEVDSTRRSQTYTNLTPGHYTFRVQGSNNDRVWNEAGVKLAITVLPPWYATWWFTTALALCVAGVLFAAHRVRLRALRLTAAKLEREVAERTVELKAAKESAEVAKEAAETANRAKSAFLSHMSHELRTPLNAILGFARLLREGGASETQRGDLDIIHRSGEHLLGLINDVLDIAKIESGRATVEIAPCDLGRLVRDVTDMMRVRAAEKNLELRLEQPPDVPQFVETDAKKLREMLINLVGNAVKHTEKGSVTLRLNSKTGPDAGHVRLSFEVQDTGIGIAPEDQERIFEPFVQVGKETRQKGTGLGLAITRQFAVLLGGSIRVSSTPGEGSIFRLEFPVTEAAPVVTESSAEREYVLEVGQPECRILVVDDDPENRGLLQRLLERAGFQVRVADGGAQGVEMFGSWRPHFVWMDLRMPEVDGPEAAQRIRALEGGRDVKISAVTASELTHSAAGMDDLVHKPYRARDIFETMARHLSVRYRSSDATLAPVAESPGVLRAEALAALPEGLRAELTNAVISLNISRITPVIKRISEIDPVLGSALKFHADRFAFTKVLQALQDSKSVTL
jgi:signal transduction histidine kinase/ligand-binding sensor domain-containing protein/CheY-like chemotaxis protein